jgi:hypothetical protein
MLSIVQGNLARMCWMHDVAKVVEDTVSNAHFSHPQL